MKKSLLAITSVGIAALLAPTAQASGSPFVVVGPIAKSADGSVQVAVSDGETTGTPGGWCNNGQPSSVIAVRNTGKARTLYVTVTTDSGKTNKLYTLKNVDSRGQFVLPLAAGAGTDTTYEVGTAIDADGSPVDDGATWTYGTALAPSSCAGLPSQLPALPSAWAGQTAPTTKPTTPAPTTSKSKPTAPAPTTSKATASGTVKVTTPGGTKTTSTSGVIPVTKPIPSGGGTATATVKVPAKVITATSTETVKPITSSAAIGPKVQTDGASSNSTLESELAGAGALALVVAGGVVVARRRSN